MQRLVTFLLVLLTSLAVSAEPKPQGSAASSGMFVRYTRTSAVAQPYVEYSTSVIMSGTDIDDDFTRTVGTTGDPSCITWGGSGVFEITYSCTKSRWMRITAHVTGYFTNADEIIYFQIGHKANAFASYIEQANSGTAAHGHASVFGLNIGTASNITIDMVLDFGESVGVMANSYAASVGGNTRLMLLQGTTITLEDVTHIYGAAP